LGLLKTLSFSHIIHPSTWAIAVDYDDSGSRLPLTFCCPFTAAKAWKESPCSHAYFTPGTFDPLQAIDLKTTTTTQ
jgi:hypothetical protein